MSPRARSASESRPASAPAGDRWRLFVAVSLPDAVQTLVGALTAEFAAEGWPVRWVAADGAHLTLHFLGEVAPERAALIRLALPAVATRHQRFDLRTNGLGVFPNPRRPRVIWLGLHGPAHRLASLHRDLGETLVELGLTVDLKPLHPHITLGRVRNQGTAAVPLRDLPDALRGRLADSGPDAAPPPPSQPLPVREIVLVRSHLGREGARYETLERYPLAATPRSGGA